ncbi:Hypothetical Protein SLY_1045 [Strawberry lethal yellows phytoplasma (CPA) str. NZSb11]|uniref:Uncharacterized protein n=1 Tax=Strawberry lethal yellows phytoplasma (CPA) str. NZSb11 TaxID=980422 RepID=R4RYK1_PHYAS|nr:Hypothetical Protein SLY_1045 [Strawberry lethal yellows phytoplasma (CPA) str. NZSb11]
MKLSIIFVVLKNNFLKQKMSKKHHLPKLLKKLKKNSAKEV